jgi:hypothetical protein
MLKVSFFFLDLGLGLVGYGWEELGFGAWMDERTLRTG